MSTMIKAGMAMLYTGEEVEERAESEHAIAFASRRFAQNLHVHERVNRLACRNVRAVEIARRELHVEDRLLERVVEQTNGVRVRGDGLPETFTHGKDLPARGRGRTTHLFDATQKKLQPS